MSSQSSEGRRAPRLTYFGHLLRVFSSLYSGQRFLCNVILMSPRLLFFNRKSSFPVPTEDLFCAPTVYSPSHNGHLPPLSHLSGPSLSVPHRVLRFLLSLPRGPTRFPRSMGGISFDWDEESRTYSRRESGPPRCESPVDLISEPRYDQPWQ